MQRACNSVSTRGPGKGRPPGWPLDHNGVCVLTAGGAQVGPASDSPRRVFGHSLQGVWRPARHPALHQALAENLGEFRNTEGSHGPKVSQVNFAHAPAGLRGLSEGKVGFIAEGTH